MKRILVAIDFSSHSDLALDLAVEFAKKFDAKLDLLHVFDLPIPVVNPYEIAVPPAYVKDAEESARQKLEERRVKVAAAGVETEAHLASAPIATAITEAASETNADLVVVGTHGHTGLKHALLGSVAERIVRHAPCPVLTVK